MVAQDILEKIIDEAPVVMFIYREKFIYANPYTLDVLGYSLEELKEKFVWDLVAEEFRDFVKERVRARLRGESLEEGCVELPVYTKEGKTRIMRFYATTVELKDGFAGLGVGIDVTEEKRLEEELKKEKAKLELILENLHDIVVVVDREGVIRYKSPSVQKVLGWSPKNVVGKHFSEFIHPEDVKRVGRIKDEVFSNPGKAFTVSFRVKRRDGNYRWIEANAYLPKNWEEIGLEGAVVNERDITERKEMEERIIKLNYYDPLTGLPNRQLFLEELGKLINLAEQRKEHVAVVLLNIVRFRDINVTYGPKVADEVIRKVAERLTSRLRSGDLVSRLPADEFGIALVGIKSMSGLVRAIDKIKDAFKEPFVLNGKSIYIEINMGVSIFPRDSSEPSDLLRKAEIALAKAKETGPSAVSFFSEEAEKEITEVVVFRTSLKESLRKRDVVPYYQPIFRLSDLKLVGVEALARWRHPDLGVVLPVKFVPLAEDTGLILELGQCVLNQSVMDISSLLSEGYDLFLSVNFSMRQFMDESLPDRIRDVLRTYDFPEDKFVLEITESTAMKDPEKTKKVLAQMKELGVKFAIDDFGTGYSSLEYLLEFYVDKIKIDMNFVLCMLENKKAENMVRTIINLSRSIGAVSVAEGIENKHILSKLKEMGCDEGQGYYFAPPMNFQELKDFLSKVGSEKHK